jgi:uncharacterized protein
VPQPIHPLRFNVGFIINQSIGYSREFHFENPRIDLKPDFELHQFSGSARVTRTPQGLLVQGTFQGLIKTECVRCLTDFEQPLQSEFTELYAFSPRTATESGLILPEDANIDLEPIVREYLMIEVPINPVCREDCMGLCTICGENLNESTCEHQSQENARIIY